MEDYSFSVLDQNYTLRLSQEDEYLLRFRLYRAEKSIWEFSAYRSPMTRRWGLLDTYEMYLVSGGSNEPPNRDAFFKALAYLEENLENEA